MARFTPRQEMAQQRVHELLTELGEVFGPTDDGQAVYEPGDGPTGNPTLWEYVVVCCWVDDDGKDFVTVVPAAGMLTHHAVGLLRAALTIGDYGAAGGPDTGQMGGGS
jgi:hypothetical protein